MIFAEDLRLQSLKAFLTINLIKRIYTAEFLDISERVGNIVMVITGRIWHLLTEQPILHSIEV